MQLQLELVELWFQDQLRRMQMVMMEVILFFQLSHQQVEVEVEQIYHLLLVLHVMLVDQVGLVEVVLIKVLLVQQVIRLLQIRLKVIQVVKDKMPLLDLHLQVQVVEVEQQQLEDVEQCQVEVQEVQEHLIRF
jgi:hypothetical protein|tara:strand:+ start:104 stop:502 length:399 start_codon:yes stop_codon:yes gene_type:complete